MPVRYKGVKPTKQFGGISLGIRSADFADLIKKSLDGLPIDLLLQRRGLGRCQRLELRDCFPIDDPGLIPAGAINLRSLSGARAGNLWTGIIEGLEGLLERSGSVKVIYQDIDTPEIYLFLSIGRFTTESNPFPARSLADFFTPTRR